MDAISAVVLSRDALEEMVERAARRGAEITIENFNTELGQDPRDRHVKLLRNYMADRSSIENPREMWASSHQIRQIELSNKGKPKSTAWMQQFKRKRCSLGTLRPGSHLRVEFHVQ